MTSHPLYCLALAAFGALVLTPDTLFMRWSGMDGFQMVAWRGLLMGGVLILAWAAASGGRRRQGLAALMSGAGAAIVLCHGINATLFSTAIATAPVAVVLFGVATVPVFAAIFAGLILGEPTRRATWITIAAVLAGIALAVSGGEAAGLGVNLASLWGAAAGLGVAAALALTFVILRMRPALPIALVIGCGALLSGTVGLIVTGPGAMAAGEIWAIAVSGAVILPVSFFALSLASRHTHASNVSLLLLLETVLGPAWVWLGTGEAMTPRMMLGGAVVVGSLAVYLTHAGRRRAG